VGWESRERGVISYYYRSIREGDRVRKLYVGGGVLGRLGSQQDETERLQREEEAARRREEREDFERSAGFLRELEEAAEVLTRAVLLASGCHKRRGEWRLKRERA
jgi:hypothetical protein